MPEEGTQKADGEDKVSEGMCGFILEIEQLVAHELGCIPRTHDKDGDHQGDGRNPADSTAQPGGFQKWRN